MTLHGQKRCSPPPFVDRPNHDPAKVFFVALRWIKKGVLPALRGPNHDPAKVFFGALHRKKGVLPRPSWTDQFMIPMALRGHKRWTDQIILVVLRGPSWIKKGVLPRPTWTDQIMIPQRFSSGPFIEKKVFSPALRGQTIPQRFSPWSFVALRGHKRCSPPPFVDRQNHDPAKVFSVVLRGPSWIKKGVLPRPTWTDQIMIPQRFSSWSFVALRGSKKVFSPALRGQTRILSCSSQFR